MKSGITTKALEAIDPWVFPGPQRPEVNHLMLSIGMCAQLACIWEATARKPGNVHRYCDFEDVGYVDFLLSAAAVAPVLETAGQRRVGTTVLEAVQATRRVVTTNTNLGILLLLAPLATVPPAEPLSTGLSRVLNSLDVEDARAVYQAIRLAVPGGLGQVPDQDIRGEPTKTLREVMELAAGRDLIARQYINGFREVLQEGVPALRMGLEQTASLEYAIIFCYLHLLASHPDSLITRKRGVAEAEEASRRVRQVLERGWPKETSGRTAYTELDAWLRAEGHSRNPGTTADLVTACLFVLLRDGTIKVPSRFSWLAGSDYG
jgi:triphosphoribosyl-dephospho-CoA synthase